jgi:PAS domain S-box-containing protein
VAFLAHEAQASSSETRRIVFLYDLLLTLSRARTLAEIYESALKSLFAATPATAAGILLFDVTPVLRLEALQNIPAETIEALKEFAPWKYGTLNAQPLIVPDLADSTTPTALRRILLDAGFRRLLLLPLELDEGIFGAVLLCYPEPNTTDDSELTLTQVIAGHVAFAIDRKKLEAADVLLAAIVESSDDAIVSKDLNGIVTSWNKGAERIFGYSLAEMVGRPIATIAPPDVISEMPGILERIRRGERVDHYETRRRAKSGEILDVSLSVSPIRDSSGRIIGASKIARDITEKKRTERDRAMLFERIQTAQTELKRSNDELRRANQDLETFAYSASHDLQEPLRTVTVTTQLLQKRYAAALPAHAVPLLDIIVTAAQRMESLIRDVLAYATASRQNKQPPAPVDANYVLESALEDLEASISDTGATVSCDPLPVVLAHKDRLAQVFENLISNSLKYRSNKLPRIHVAAAPEGNFWRFRLSDNGIGIDPKYADQIFTLFKRLHSQDEIAGSGIGLALCTRIVEQYGGRIWLEYSEPGKGATFCFTFPAIQ